MLGLLLATLPLEVPVDPDGDQARQWIVDELAKPQYQAAEPTLFDRISEAFWNWLNSLDLSGGGAAQAPLLVILILVIAGALIAAFLIFGAPRFNRRSAVAGALFGADETRTAEQFRRSADQAAKNEDWAVAIEELFRSIARLMTERVLVSTSPGTTAREFSQTAGTVFPEFSARLADSSVMFDRVRYFDESGTAAEYKELVGLERELRTARPSVAESPLNTGRAR